jgi:hypothetical protein
MPSTRAFHAVIHWTKQRFCFANDNAVP